MFKKLDANLMVQSVEKSLNFYKNILGFSEVAAVPGETGLVFAILEKDGQNLMVQEKNSLVSELPSYQTEAIKPTVTIYIVVDNFVELYADLKSKTEIAVELHTTDYGAEEFAVADPDGYIICFAKFQEN